MKPLDVKALLVQFDALRWEHVNCVPSVHEIFATFRNDIRSQVRKTNPNVDSDLGAIKQVTIMAIAQTVEYFEAQQMDQYTFPT